MFSSKPGKKVKKVKESALSSFSVSIMLKVAVDAISNKEKQKLCTLEVKR